MFRRKKKQTITDVAALPLILGGAVIAAADIGRRAYRRSQVFCPSREPAISWDPTDYGIAADAVEEHWIDTPDGERLHAWYCRAEKPVASGVFCHGNTGNLTTSADTIPHLLAAGLNVLFFDYRGFGKSSGWATVRGVISDGIAAARFHETIRPAHLPSVLYGFSLGGGVAAQVIRRHPFDALILQSTFTSLPRLTRVMFPRAPMHLLAGDLFDTYSVVKRLQVPLLVIHGTDDEAIPCSMAHELFDACPGEKRIHCIEGGLHKDLFVRDPDSIVWHLSRFLADLPRHRRTPSVEAQPKLEEWAHAAMRTVRGVFRGGLRDL